MNASLVTDESNRATSSPYLPRRRTNVVNSDDTNHCRSRRLKASTAFSVVQKLLFPIHFWKKNFCGPEIARICRNLPRAARRRTATASVETRGLNQRHVNAHDAPSSDRSDGADARVRKIGSPRIHIPFGEGRGGLITVHDS